MKKSYQSLGFVFAAVTLASTSAFANETPKKDVSIYAEGEALALRHDWVSVPEMQKDKDGKDTEVDSVKEKKFNPGFRFNGGVEMNGYDVNAKVSQLKHYGETKVEKKEVEETPESEETKEIDLDRSHTTKFKLQDAELTVGRAFTFDNGFSIKPMIGAHTAKVSRNFATQLSTEEKAERAENGEMDKKYSNKKSKFRGVGPQAGFKVEQRLVEGLKLVGSVSQSILFSPVKYRNVADQTVTPVTKANIGAAWNPVEAFELAAGYEMQYWFDGSEVTSVTGKSLAKNLKLDGVTVRAKVSF